MFGYRKIHHDLLSLGERCAANTVAKLMRDEGLRAQVGYKRRPGKYGTKPAIVATNQLQQDFNVDAPDRVWVTDITYIRTHEGWLYLAAVIDLYSRKIVGYLSAFATQLPVGRRVYAFTNADIASFRCFANGRMET